MAVGTHSTEPCRCSRPETCVDRQRGRYLTAVYRLTRGQDERARTGEVGDRLGVSPASVTEMFERLADEDLVEYEKRDGVELTGEGAEVARELARRQCVVRTFFAAELGLDLSSETGYRIGFVLPGDGIDQLRALASASPGASRRDPDSEAGACRFGHDGC